MLKLCLIFFNLLLLAPIFSQEASTTSPATSTKAEEFVPKKRRTAAGYAKDADKLLLDSKFAEAKQTYLLAIDKSPKMRYLYNLAAICIDMNEHEEALGYLEKIYKKLKKNILIKEAIAYVYFRLDRFDDSIAICDTVLKKDPFSSKLLTVKALSTFRKGQEKEAIAMLREAYINSKDESFKETIATIYYLDGQVPFSRMWFGDDMEAFGVFEQNLKKEYNLETAEEKAERLKKEEDERLGR